jgi:hypothetical protein
MKMEQIECSETSAYKIQTSWNHPEEMICLKSEAEQSKLFHSNKMTGLYVQRGLWWEWFLCQNFFFYGSVSKLVSLELSGLLLPLVSVSELSVRVVARRDRLSPPLVSVEGGWGGGEEKPWLEVACYVASWHNLDSSSSFLIYPYGCPRRSPCFVPVTVIKPRTEIYVF